MRLLLLRVPLRHRLLRLLLSSATARLNAPVERALVEAGGENGTVLLLCNNLRGLVSVETGCSSRNAGSRPLVVLGKSPFSQLVIGEPSIGVPCTEPNC